MGEHHDPGADARRDFCHDWSYCDWQTNLRPGRWFGGSHRIAGAPVFVLTHDAPATMPQGATPFTFVTDGIESALKQAKAAAGEKQVYVMGSASIAGQCLQAGLLDEIQLHLVPMLLGGGIRLFDHIGTKLIQLESVKVIEATGVIHLRFRVVK